MSDYGLLQEVIVAARGSTLAADAGVSDTELVIDYAGDFDDEGGTLDLNGARLAYTGIVDGTLPDDPDTLLLASALAAAADEDDDVSVVAGGQILTDYYAIVTMGDEGDHIRVPLTIDQRNQWPVGVYDDPVPVMVSDDLQHLEDAPGRTPTGRVAFENTDTATYPGSGDMLLLLTHTPIDGSTHIRQNGISLDPSEWTRSGFTVTIADTGHFKTGDVFTAAYAYDGAGGDVSVSTEVGPLVPVGTTTGNNNAATSIAVPGGASVGDFFVLMLAGVPVIGSGTVDCSDSRVDGSIKTHVFNGVYWGRLDTLANISISITGSKAAYALAVYSDVHTVTSSDSDASQTPTPMTAPPVTYHGNAIACFFTNIASSGTVTGPGADADSDWTQDAVAVSTTSVCGVGIYSLADGIGGTTPPGAVSEGTTLDWWDVVTLGVD